MYILVGTDTLLHTKGTTAFSLYLGVMVEAFQNMLSVLCTYRLVKHIYPDFSGDDLESLDV